ncbi:putative ABC1 protein [Hordeum vulgare]|nr:putative ABC1 protein [Hordeum vulgare]
MHRTISILRQKKGKKRKKQTTPRGQDPQDLPVVAGSDDGAGAHAIATSEDPARTLKICRHLPPRLLRDSVAAATIDFDYHYSLWGLQPDSPAWLNAERDAHLRSANRLQDLCFLNGGIYIKLRQHIAQLIRQRGGGESLTLRLNSLWVHLSVCLLCEGGELLDRILAKKNSRYSEKDAA